MQWSGHPYHHYQFINDDRLLYDNVQERRSREASGEPGQDSEPGYDLVSPIAIIILVFITSDSEPGQRPGGGYNHNDFHGHIFLG